jgi:hypothetical protein
MYRKKSLIVAVVLLMISVMLVGAVWPHSPAPIGFDNYLVFTAAGLWDPSVPPEEGDLADWFHFEIMGRTQEEFEAEMAAADAFFAATYPTYVPGSLEPFGLDPRVEYRAYFVSGRRVSPEGWVVRDGGFIAFITLESGTEAMIVHGHYNIEVPKPGRGPAPDPIIIHYRSEEPIVENPYLDPPGIMFLCVLEHEEWGEGVAQGISVTQPGPDGKVQSNIRNILTFPPYGPSFVHD